MVNISKNQPSPKNQPTRRPKTATENRGRTFSRKPKGRRPKQVNNVRRSRLKSVACETPKPIAGRASSPPRLRKAAAKLGNILRQVLSPLRTRRQRSTVRPQSHARRPHSDEKITAFFQDRIEKMRSNDVTMIKLSKKEHGNVLDASVYLSAEGMVLRKIPVQKGSVSKREDFVGGGALKTAFKLVNEQGNTVAVRLKFKQSQNIKKYRTSFDIIEMFKDDPNLSTGHVVTYRSTSKLDPSGNGDNIVQTEIIAPFKPTDLSKVSKELKLTPAQQRSAMRQILQGLKSLHQRDCAHLDIKPANIVAELVGSDIDVKITDFDTSVIGKEQSVTLGTKCFWAPELLTDDSSAAVSPQKADIYATAITFLIIQGKVKESELNKIMIEDWKSRGEKGFGYISREILEAKGYLQPEKDAIDRMIWQMMESDPSKRLDAEGAIQALI